MFSKYLICHPCSLSIPAGQVLKQARGLLWVWACWTDCFAWLSVRERSDSLSLSSASLSLLFLQVIFDGEEAVDAGGVTKEFFLLLLKELLNPIYGMFTYYPESNLLWFSDTVSPCPLYMQVGVMCFI